MSASQSAQTGFRAWIPVIGLAFAAFVFNTSEFLPVGCCPTWRQASTSQSPSWDSLLPAMPGWCRSCRAARASYRRFERKKLLLFLLGLFAICHFAVLWVDSFWSLYATRIGVALAHSIFWSIMNPLAARMAPAGKRATGLAAVMGGTIVATVLGVPLGTKMGHLFGWAESFFVIGAAAFLVLMLLWYGPAAVSGAGVPARLRACPSFLSALHCCSSTASR